MHIEFKNLCNASKHMTMHISNANNQVHDLAPPICVLLLSKNFDTSPFFNVALSLSMSMSMSNLYFFVSISPKAFISLYNLFSFVINFHKRFGSYWCKRLHWGRWLMLESCIFMDITWLLEWHHLYSSWDTTYRIFDLDTNLWDTSPYVIAWVIHLLNLSSCSEGCILHLMIT